MAARRRSGVPTPRGRTASARRRGGSAGCTSWRPPHGWSSLRRTTWPWMDTRLRGGRRRRVLGRVAVVEDQRVAVGVGEDRLVADAAVDRVAAELDALLLQGRAARLDVGDLQRDPCVARLVLDAERVGLDERDREVVGLELAGREGSP